MYPRPPNVRSLEWVVFPFSKKVPRSSWHEFMTRLISLTRDATITKKLSIFLFKKGKKRKRFIRQLEKLDHKLTVNLIWSSSEEEGDRVTVYYYSIYSARQILSSKKKKKKMRGERSRFEYHWCARLSFRRTQPRYEASSDFRVELANTRWKRVKARVCLLISGQNKKTFIITWPNWFQYYFGKLIFRHLILLKNE